MDASVKAFLVMTLAVIVGIVAYELISSTFGSSGTIA